MERLFFHLVPSAAAAAWRTAATAWRWLIAPPKGNSHRVPPIPHDGNAEGIGWRGRHEFRPFGQSRHD